MMKEELVGARTECASIIQNDSGQAQSPGGFANTLVPAMGVVLLLPQETP